MTVRSYLICRLDGKGRAKPIVRRISYGAAIREVARHRHVFIVQELLGQPGTSDEGTVFFYDECGNEVEMDSV